MSFRRQLGYHLRTLFSNLDQPGMPATEKWAKFARNRFKATVLLRGCCGRPGEPGC